MISAKFQSGPVLFILANIFNWSYFIFRSILRKIPSIFHTIKRTIYLMNDFYLIYLQSSKVESGGPVLLILANIFILELFHIVAFYV